MRVWSVGEVLWDVFDGEREVFGGAPLNFCAHLARLGHEATLLSAVGEDERGRKALDRMRALGLNTRGVETAADLATGTAVVHLNSRGEATFRIGRPAAFDSWRPTAALLEEAAQAPPEWLYLGTLLQTTAGVEQATRDLLDRLAGTRVFYDMNLRDGHWSLELVTRLTLEATVLKLNEHEAATLWGLGPAGGGVFSLPEFCADWSTRFGLQTILVTLGDKGCYVFHSGAEVTAPALPVKVEDTVGAGDAFAAAFLHGLDQGWHLPQTARFANALGALVASRPGATPPWTLEEVEGLMAGRRLS